MTPTTDQEHVASLAVDHSLGEVPVVSDAGRLLGVVPSTALVDILRREHIEDMRRFVGVLKEDERATRALQVPPLRRLYERLPWLLYRLRLDPAFGSGPVSTIVQDVLSLLVNFWTVSLVVR